MIKVYEFSGQTEDQCHNTCLETLDVYYRDLLIKDKSTGELYQIDVLKKEDVVEYIKSYLQEIAKSMKMQLNLEIKEDEDTFYILMVSDNNPILIGKDGRTIDSIQYLLRQSLLNQTGFNVKIYLDAANYRSKKEKFFQNEIQKIIKEVEKTKIDAKLDPMNSYKRRLVHSLVSKYDHIETESMGEEPERYVVIKYVEK